MKTNVDHISHILALTEKNISKNIFTTQENACNIYLASIYDELQEVESEMRGNNAVHLEDELGDVLWNYLMLLHTLNRDGYITSVDAVFERSYSKFRERLTCLEEPKGNQGMRWAKIKKQQKERLKNERDKKYAQ